MRKKLFAFLFVFSLLLPSAALGQAVKITPAEQQMADGITAKQLSDYLYFVASDAMEGRDTPSRGLDTDGRIHQDELSTLGLQACRR